MKNLKKMRTLSLIIATSFIITNFSCGKKDDNNTTLGVSPPPSSGGGTSTNATASSLVGSWLLDTTDVLLDPTDQMIWKDIIWEFTSDGKFKGDLSFECFYGCDSSFYFYANYSIVNNKIKFETYGDSDDPVYLPEDPNETYSFDIHNFISNTEISVSENDAENGYNTNDDVYRFIKIK